MIRPEAEVQLGLPTPEVAKLEEGCTPVATSEQGTEGVWLLAPKPPGVGTAGKNDSAPAAPEVSSASTSTGPHTVLLLQVSGHGLTSWVFATPLAPMPTGAKRERGKKGRGGGEREGERKNMIISQTTAVPCTVTRKTMRWHLRFHHRLALQTCMN